MAKKSKGRGKKTAARRMPPSKAATRRRRLLKTKRKKVPKLRGASASTTKSGKLKTKKPTDLLAKGGGNATAAGVTFQASVGAVYAVQMLTESFGDEQLGLAPFKAKSIRFESDAPLDDIVVETDQGGWLLLQAKTKLSLSSSPDSEFGKTAEQIVRQWHAGLTGKGSRGWDRPLNLAVDRLIIAVGPATSQSVTIDLARALSSTRAQATAPLPAKHLAALRTLTAALKRAWKSVTGKAASDADVAAILPLIAVVRFDMAGPDRNAAIAQMRLLTLQAPAAHGAFVATERECQALMERRHGADAKAFRQFIAQGGVALKAPPSYQPDIDIMRQYSNRIATELDAFETTTVDGKPISIERAVTDAVVQAAKEGSLLVIGDPGSGKSAVVSAAASALRDAKCEVIQFAVDRLPVDTADGLRGEIGLTHRLLDVLENWPGTKPAYLFIDALDATRGGRGEAVFRSLIKDVMTLPGDRWRVIASIRSFDLRLGEQFRELFSGAPPNDGFKDKAFPAVQHINVPTWSEAEFSTLLAQAKSLATAIAQGGDKLRDLAAVPFNTRLLADLLSTGLSANAFGEVKSQVELLGIYWNWRVTPLGTAADLCLRSALELMVTNHTLQAERLSVASASPSALDSLFQANVLIPLVSDRYVAFRHHILFDYAASRLFIDPLNISSIAARLESQPGLALMLAPALAYALHDIWLQSDKDRVQFWAAVVELTGETPSDPVARSVAARMASELPADTADVAGLVNLLNSSSHRAKAAKAFMHMVGALTVRIEDGLSSPFAPWCQLAAELSSHTDIVAWPLRTLLSQIVGKVVDTNQRAQLGLAARALLLFALSDKRGEQLVTIGIELVGETYETSVDESCALLAQLLTGNRFADHAHEDMPALARKAKRIASYDPDFVVEIYRTAFGQNVVDTSPTPMGRSQILSMTSNKRQDYTHARWQLKEYFAEFLEGDPAFGVRVLIAALEGQVASEHTWDAVEQPVVINGQTVRLLEDGSHIWANDPDDRHAHADNIASMIGAFKKRLLDAPAADAVQLAQIAIRENRLAVVWARLFFAAAKRPDDLGAVVLPLASSHSFLRASDTRKDAIDAVAASYPTLNPDEKRRFEEGASKISFDDAENPERAKRRLLATLFNAIGESNLETQAAKQLLNEAVAESLPRGNNRAYSIFTETREADPYYWLSENGVDILAAPNAALLRLAEAVSERPGPNGMHSLGAKEAMEALKALNFSLGSAAPASPMVIDHARTTLLHGCASLTRRKPELAADNTIVQQLADIVEPYLDIAGEQKSRAIAAEASLFLCATTPEAARRLVPKIEPLLTDSADEVRLAVADDFGNLWEFDRDALWRFADYLAQKEQSFSVLQRFAAFLCRAVHHAPEKIESLTLELLPRARQEDKARGDRLIEAIGSLVAVLWLRYELPRSRGLLDEWMTDLNAHKAELTRAAASLRDTVIKGYDGTDQDDIRLRTNAQRLAREMVEVTAKALERYMALVPTLRTEADNLEVQAAAQLLGTVGDQLYYSSGAFRANDKEQQTGLASIESRKAFLDDNAVMLHRIGDAAAPNTIYNFLDMLRLLRPADPAFVFDLVSNALLKAGQMHGFHYEGLGADRFVQIVGIFLADDRAIFNDPARRAALIACLDAFVEAGWPTARRLLYRLPELL